MATTQIPSFTGADFSTRMDVLKQIANHTGIRLPQTIIPEGESLIPYGEERQRALRDEIYSLPDIMQAFAVLRDIRAEQQPADIKVPLQLVRMNPTNGGLYGQNSPNSAPLGYTGTAFSQVAATIKPSTVQAGFAQTLLALPPVLRSAAFDYFAEKSVGGKDAILRTIKAPTRTASGLILRRSINAVVSERYTVVEDHDLVHAIAQLIPDGARVRYTQTESRSDLEILWPAMTRQLKVGDIAVIALQITNSQTKQSCIDIAAKVLRVLCLNFTTAWSEGGDSSISIRHVGEVKTKLAAAIRNALAIVEPFILAFGDAYQSNLPTFAPTRGEAILRFIKKFALPEKVGEQISASWDMDGSQSAGDTLAGLANAATRVSQGFTIGQAEPIEAAAGRLVREGWSSIE